MYMSIEITKKDVKKETGELVRVLLSKSII